MQSLSTVSREVWHWVRRNLCAFIVFSLCLPAFFVPNCLRKTGHNPPVGVYIAIVGGLAAYVTFREKPRPAEKAAWIVIITLITVAEIRNLYVADAEQVAKFTQISGALDATSRGLDATAKGIDATAKALDRSNANSQSQFRATTDRLRAAVKSSEEASKNTKPYALITSLALSPSGNPRPAPAVIFPNQAFEINAEFTNSGNESAKDVVLDIQTYVDKPDDIATQQELVSRFNKWWEKAKHESAIPEVAPHDQRLATFNSMVFSPDDIKALIDKSKTLYLLIRWTYSDSSGRWANDTCFGYQYVYRDFNVLHPCRPEYNRQRYAYTK